LEKFLPTGFFECASSHQVGNPKQEAAMIEERIAITIKHAQSRDLADFALSRFIIISNTWKLLKGCSKIGGWVQSRRGR